MGSIGTPEIIIIAVLALIIFGPKKMPEIGRAIGSGLRELKKASRDIMDEVYVAVDDEDEDEIKKQEDSFKYPEDPEDIENIPYDSYENDYSVEEHTPYDTDTDSDSVGPGDTGTDNNRSDSDNNLRG